MDTADESANISYLIDRLEYKNVILQDLTRKLDNCKEEIKTLKAQKATQTEEKTEKLPEELRVTQERLEAALSDNEKLNDKLHSALSEQHAKDIADGHEQEEKLEKQDGTIAILRDQYKKAIKEISRLMDENSALEKELAKEPGVNSYLTSLQEKEEEIEILKSTIREIKADYDKAIATHHQDTQIYDEARRKREKKLAILMDKNAELQRAYAYRGELLNEADRSKDQSPGVGQRSALSEETYCEIRDLKGQIEELEERLEALETRRPQTGDRVQHIKRNEYGTITSFTPDALAAIVMDSGSRPPIPNWYKTRLLTENEFEVVIPVEDRILETGSFHIGDEIVWRGFNGIIRDFQAHKESQSRPGEPLAGIELTTTGGLHSLSDMPWTREGTYTTPDGRGYWAFIEDLELKPTSRPKRTIDFDERT